MRVFDASSIIYAWDNYPIAQFPSLWNWMANGVARGEIQMSEVALEEVYHKTQECADWLKNAGLRKIPVTESVLQEAFRIKELLEIEEDKYGAGVDENDLFIIATAKLQAMELVTDESFQPKPPNLKRNYKIPAVCALDTVNVSWTNFLNYLKNSNTVFG